MRLVALVLVIALGLSSLAACASTTTASDRDRSNNPNVPREGIGAGGAAGLTVKHMRRAAGEDHPDAKGKAW